MITRKIIIAVITSILGIMMLSGCGETNSQTEAIHTSNYTTTTTTTTVIVQSQIKGQAIKEDLPIENKKVTTKATNVETKETTQGKLIVETEVTAETTNAEMLVEVLTETETTITSDTTSTTTELTEFQTNTYYEIPEGDTSFYAYMDWKAITDYNSPQYNLLSQGWTDSQGIRRVGDDVCIALGTYYTKTVGDRFIITTDMGNSYTAVVGDIKADCHTDSKNQYRWAGNNSKNVVEFIVDTNSLDYTVKTSGNIGTYDNYSGQIISIQKIN